MVFVVDGLSRNEPARNRASGLRMSEKHNWGMNTRLFEHWRIWIVLLASMALMGPLALGAGYLPLVGPPPLRFEKVAEPRIFSWAPAVLVPVASTPPPVAVETNFQPVTSTVPANNVISSPAPIEPASVPPRSPPENLSTNSMVQSRPANDLLVVTPEMLVDYFKPNRDAAKVADVHVLAPVNFTPPASVSNPSSQAIYISQ